MDTLKRLFGLEQKPARAQVLSSTSIDRPEGFSEFALEKKPPEEWTDEEHAFMQERMRQRRDMDPLYIAMQEGREAERKAGASAQPVPFSPGRLAEDFEGMLVDDLRSRDIHLQRHAPELQQLSGGEQTETASAPKASAPTKAPTTRSAGRATPRADVQPLDSSLAVKAGEALLARLKSPGNGSALPDSVRQWARKGQPAQSQDASGSGGGEGGNGTSRMDWARMIDSGAATVAGVKPNSEFYDAVERRGERKDNLQAEKEKTAQAESLRRAQMAQSERQHTATLEQSKADGKQRAEDRSAAREDRALDRKRDDLYRSTLLEVRRGQVKDGRDSRGDRDFYLRMDRLRKALPKDAGFVYDTLKDISNAVNSGADLGIGMVEGGFPQFMRSEEGKRVVQKAQSLYNRETKEFAGTAVSAQEAERLERAMGSIGAARSFGEFKVGLQMMEDSLNDRLLTAYRLSDPDVVEEFVGRGGPRPTRGDWRGQDGGGGGHQEKPQGPADTVQLVRVRDGKPVTVPRDRAEATMRAKPGIYRIE